MRVKIPREIKIATHSYRVEFNPLLWHEESLKGMANHIKQVIQIDPVLAHSQKTVTLLHEINHVINDTFRCKLDEDEIDKMAQGQAEFLDCLGIELDWSEIEDG